MKINFLFTILIVLTANTLRADDSDKPYDINLGSQLVNVPSGIQNTAFVADLSKQDYEFFSRSVAQYAIKNELLDPREAHYLLTRKETFQNDLDVIRQRRKDFETIPLVADAKRFPDKFIAGQKTQFNRSFHRFIESRKVMEADRLTLLNAISTENQHLFQIWDAVYEAQCEYYYITVRRLSLQKLQSFLGEEDYDMAILPDNVPTWRFNEMQ